jgi:cytidine deaminase
MDDDQTTVDKLIDASFAAKSRAYCPYSNFPVGAALLCDDGTIVLGCNVENAAHSPGVCAERTAISSAVAQGHRKFKAIAIATDVNDSFVFSCGTCRQAMAEFGLDWKVYITKPDKSYVSKTVRELLPFSFGSEVIASFNNGSSSTGASISHH